MRRSNDNNNTCVLCFIWEQVNIEECDYLVDADYPLRPVSTREPRYIQDEKNWEIVDCAPALDAVNSNQLSRAFYVPGSGGLAWADYCLLKKRRS